MKIIADEAIPQLHYFFSKLGEITTLPACKITHESLNGQDILLIRSRTKVTKTLIGTHDLKFIGSAVSGEDHIDHKALRERNIPFAHAKGCNAQAVSEYVANVVLEYALKYRIEVQTLSVGLMGAGHVGMAVSRALNSLNIKTLLYDPPLQKQASYPKLVDLQQVLDADILSLHIPLTESGPYATREWIDESILGRLKARCFINAARGEVINEQALINHIKQGHLRHCVIDCWHNEPSINPELAAVCYRATPHIAGHSNQARVKGTYMLACQLYEQLNLSLPYDMPLGKKRAIQLMNDSHANAYEALADIFRQCYDYADDHLSLPSIESTFLQKRTRYPKRLEWSEISVTFSDNLNITPWANHLKQMLALLNIECHS